MGVCKHHHHGELCLLANRHVMLLWESLMQTARWGLHRIALLLWCSVMLFQTCVNKKQLKVWDVQSPLVTWSCCSCHTYNRQRIAVHQLWAVYQDNMTQLYCCVAACNRLKCPCQQLHSQSITPHPCPVLTLHISTLSSVLKSPVDASNWCAGINAAAVGN